MGLTRDQAVECFASHDLIGIGMEADAVRRRLHPEGVVTYALNAFVDASTTSVQEAVTAAIEQGVTGIVLYGFAGSGVPGIETVLTEFRSAAPELRLGLLESEVAGLLERNALAETLRRFEQCGLAWIEGDHAQSSSIRLHRAAHAAGLSTVASLRFGAGERVEDRIAKLEALRQLQAETGGVRAFSLHSAPARSARELDDPTAVEYLRLLAICRMVLDNVDTLEANWDQQGLKVLQMALRFGANDVGSLMGRRAQASEEEVRRLIRDAGFQPVRRDSLSTTMFFD